MNDRRLTSVSTAALFEELTTRVLRLADDAERPGGIGSMRTLLTEAYEAGRCAGIGVHCEATATRMRHLLDEATARMPDVPPPGIDANEAAVQYWRQGRQHLFQLVGAEGEAMKAAADVQLNAAAKRAALLQQRTNTALAPAAPLRQRAGRWLYELGVRMSQRGAS
jgi:hypothetical protein